jgi:hypothetical protein
MMSLTRNQFTILSFLEAEKDSLIQNDTITRKTGISIDVVRHTLDELWEIGLLDKYSINSKGIEALEPYRVKRAVFIAAGFGSRLVPITLNTPKPLVRVRGVRIIDTMLDALAVVGIKEIIIVRGYLGEQFDQLLYKYPNIKFIENPIFNETTNQQLLQHQKFTKSY